MDNNYYKDCVPDLQLSIDIPCVAQRCLRFKYNYYNTECPKLTLSKQRGHAEVSGTNSSSVRG